MKKLIVSAILGLMSSVAVAQHYHHHHNQGHGHRQSYQWLAPILITGAVTYALTRPQPVYQPPVITRQPVNVVEVVYIDGVPYYKQTIIINGVWQEVLVKQ